MKPYLAYFKMILIARLQYRAAAWSGALAQLFWGFMQLMIYRAFYESSTMPLPMLWEQVACYVWVRQAFFILVNEVYTNDDITKKVTDGGISYELCRPMDVYFTWYSRLAAGRISAAILRCPIVLVVTLLLPGWIGLPLPASLPSLLLFIVSILLGMLLLNTFLMFVYIVTIRTLSLRGPRTLILLTTGFLMGAEIPLPFMPDRLQQILSHLPFRYIQDLPLRLYSGNIAVSEALPLIVMQASWVIALVAIGKLAMYRQMRYVVAQGG
jgi:ABC-2 type transport system permease protein